MNWWRRKQREQDLERELRSDLELEAEEHRETGLPPEEARYAARRALGNTALVKEDVRAVWGWSTLEQLLQDLRYGARVLRKNLGFALVAILTLAIGIGANTALFTAMDALLWKLLPVHEPERLVTLTGVRPNARELNLIPSTFFETLRHSSVISDVFTTTWDGLSLSVGNSTERIMGEVVSPNYFAALGVRPYLGQGFSQTGPWKPEAVLNYDYWRRRFHADPRVIGTTVHINTYPFTIVGVAPAGFFGTEVGISPEVRIPMMPPGAALDQIDMVNAKRVRALLAIGRLKDGVSRAEAEAATDALFQHFLQKSDGRVKGIELRHVRLSPAARGTSEIRGLFTRPLTILFVAVALLLLVACATVANLLLAKASARSREIALRIAVGAGRGRLLRQLLTESMLLSFLGGAAGLVLSFSMTAALFAYLPQTHRLIVLDLEPDRRAIAFTFCVALLTGAVFGLVPAWQTAGGAVADALKMGSGWLSFRRVLVSAQVALSLLLIMGAALLIQSLRNLRLGDYGFAPERVLLFTMKPQREVYSAERIRQIAAELRRRVGELPGVTNVAWAEAGPLDSRGIGSTTVWTAGGESVRTLSDVVTPDFFETTGIRLVRGRDFSPSDRIGTEEVAIVDEVLDRSLFHGQDPVGRTILTGRSESERKPLRVIGLVRSSRYSDVHAPAEPILYRPFAQLDPYMPTLHVKTALADPRRLIQEVQRQFALVDPGVPVFNIKTLGARVDEALARERLLASLAGVFGLIALLLAAVGLYGVIAYEMSRRTREIGIRMALGANPATILQAVLRESVVVALGGIAAGLPLAAAGARFLSSSLYGVSANDALTAISCSATIAAVAIMAGLIPAWRASRIDPMAALRT
jgi:predicted permease